MIAATHRAWVAELGLTVPGDRFPALLEAVKRTGRAEGRLVTDAELPRLVRRGG